MPLIPRGQTSGSVCLAIVLLGTQTILAQKYKPDDAIPPGAQGKVLPIQGKVVDVKGLTLGVVGKTQDLNAALRDLGAKKHAKRDSHRVVERCAFRFRQGGPLAQGHSRA
jgi:hypothetical protein